MGLKQFPEPRKTPALQGEERRLGAPESGPPREQTRVWIFVAFSVLLAALFFQPLLALAVYAAGQQLHSHILLIPSVSAYLIYIRRLSLPTDYTFSPGWAMIPLVAGVIALAAAWLPSVFGGPLSHNDDLALMALSFVCFVGAGGFFVLGRKWMTAAAFPFAFLIFMVPMPDAMADTLETASALASADAASLFFNLTGTPTLREGPGFQLPNIVIQVAQE